ncbi:MAG: DMT family transporter [Kiritimatiellales bacterium]|nr:DMT family transporter [Kiritimatiellales bacterium]
MESSIIRSVMFITSPSARHLALSHMLLAVILANLNPIFSKILYSRGWTPVSLYFVTIVIVGIVLLMHEYIDYDRNVRWTMRRQDFFGVLATTITGGVLAPLFFFTGLQYVAASESIIISSMLPFFVVMFGILLLGEHFKRQTIFGGIFIVFGVLIILWPDISSFELSKGVPFILGSTFFGALTTITHKKYVKHRHLDSVVLIRTLISIVIVGLWMLIFEPNGFKIISMPENIWLILALPIISFILPYFLFFNALKKLKAIDAGILEAAGRVFAVVAASVILREKLTSYYLISMIFVVFGVLFINVPLTKWKIVPSRLMEVGPLRK